jgi:beta-alanine--pyruvate transaminase
MFTTVQRIPQFAHSMRTMSTTARKSFGGFWQPFSDHDKANHDPKVFVRADGMHYYTEDNKEILDGTSGLWCCNAGHNQRKIVEAVQKQVGTLDYAHAFITSHRKPSEFAQRLCGLLPGRDFSEVFFTMCGSSAVDSALKIALQYHRSKGEAQRVRFIGRERGYHGVGFGGISVGGLSGNRKAFSSQLLPFVDHLPHTHSFKDMAFSQGMPTWGAHLAEDLERLCTLHDPSNIAAVIVEPIAGSTGVLPPPVGYLKRIREICDKHGLLLIFDEVITGFGRTGASFATEQFDVTPDMITCAKGLTNGVVPAGAVICQSHIFDTIYTAAHPNKEFNLEMVHGYTYSGHPLAMAAGLATLDVYEEQKLFENSNNLAPYFEQAIHSVKGLPHVIDVRNYGTMGAIEFDLVPGAPFKRIIDIFDRCWQKGVLIRPSGGAIAFSPPLIMDKTHIDRIFNVVAESIVESAKEMK